MDDLPVFENFLSTQCGLTVNRARDKTVVCVNSFNAILDNSYADIDDIVKNTHATNSARPANGKILIPASAIVDLKDLIFELEDRVCCGVLLVLNTFKALDVVQVN